MTLARESPAFIPSRGPRPSFISSGFSTVDVLLEDEVRASPGGTSTNVARALQSLGWQTQVIGTVGADPAGDFLRLELQNDGVGVEFLFQDEAWTTPVLLQEESRGDHVWKFSCPVCGTRFAKHRPTPERFAHEIFLDVAAPDVFFFDRASLFTLALARKWSQDGSFVIFEPAGLGRPHLFDQAISIASLVKYSEERAPAFRERLKESSAILVETMGRAGARYKTGRGVEWKNLPTKPVTKLVDTAGAGDWTSAGLIDALVDVEVGSPTELLTRAISMGQNMGALACSWEGVFPGALRVLNVDFEDFGCPRIIHNHTNSTETAV